MMFQCTSFSTFLWQHRIELGPISKLDFPAVSAPSSPLVSPSSPFVSRLVSSHLVLFFSCLVSCLPVFRLPSEGWESYRSR